MTKNDLEKASTSWRDSQFRGMWYVPESKACPFPEEETGFKPLTIKLLS